MPHEFDPARPIYTQLAELMIQAIASGDYAPGDRLPGVRELAMTYGVNPNTAQRTMAELERQGLVYSERTSGRFVTTDEALIKETRQGAALKEAALFLEKMSKLGFSAEEVHTLLLRAQESEREE